jgi:hypothetical protein
MWVIHSNFKIKGSLSWTLTYDLRFWLLKQNLQMTKCFWLELDHVILLMVDNVNVRDVELAGAEFSHQFGPIKTIRVIDPAAFLVKD